MGNDMVLTHIAGGEVAIHMIHENGHYEYAVLGDVERNPRARYAVVIPAHTYVADELLTEEYSLGNSVAIPKYEESEYKTVDANELFTKFPQHKEIIKRAFMFGEHDTPTDLKSAVERAFQITETRQYNNQYPRQYGQYQIQPIPNPIQPTLQPILQPIPNPIQPIPNPIRPTLQPIPTPIRPILQPIPSPLRI